MTKKVPFLTVTCRYTILCTCRLQPPRDDCAVRVQWFSSVRSNEVVLLLSIIFLRRYLLMHK